VRAWRGLSEPIRQQEPAYITAMAPYRAPGSPFTDWDLETTVQSSVKSKYRVALFSLEVGFLPPTRRGERAHRACD